VQGSNVNVGASGFEQRAPPPRPDAGDKLLELTSLDDSRFNPGRELWQLILGDVEIARKNPEAANRENRETRR
jgi:hypothetical protein